MLLFGPQKNAFKIQISSDERLGPQDGTWAHAQGLASAVQSLT